MGLERLFDLMLQFIDLFRFWVVIDEFEEAVVLRLGRYHRTLGPGIHWKYPFDIEVVLADNVVVRTSGTSSLTLTLADGASVTVAAMTRWRIKDIRKVLLEVEGIDDVMRDSTYANLSKAVRQAKWEDLLTPEWEQELNKQIRRNGFKYGIEIEEVRLTDCVQVLPVALLADK